MNQFRTSCDCLPGHGAKIEALTGNPMCAPCHTGCDSCSFDPVTEAETCTKCKMTGDAAYALDPATGKCGAVCVPIRPSTTPPTEKCEAWCPGGAGIVPRDGGLVCEPCLTCAAGQERKTCTATCTACEADMFKDIVGVWNTTCAPCTDCPEPYYTEIVCSKTQNAVCQLCSDNACPDGSIRTGCGGSNAGTCIACPLNSYKKNATHCDTCTLCPEGQRTPTATCSGNTDTDLGTCEVS